MIGIFFVMISWVALSFWIAKGIWIDCIPSKQKWMLKCWNSLTKFDLPSSTDTWSCPDWIQLWSKFCGKFVKLSSNSFWLSNIFSLIFWFWLWINKCCLLSSSKFLNEAMIVGGGCCCTIFCAGVRKFSSFEDSSQDSSVDVMSSWNEFWSV